MLDSILFTIGKRWYVFTFLIAFLVVASYHWGWKRTLKFLLLGYVIAWASEASSIRNGFPYGWYSYHYEQMQGELFLWGVPIWDSLSYTFLSFASWMTALWLRARWNPRHSLNELQRSWLTILLGAFLMMMIDVVIDPVAHQGEKWFLGNIYHYPYPGKYFDVPFSNFAGWFLVGLAILSAFRLTDELKAVPSRPGSIQLGVALFAGVYFFNLGITVAIGDYRLAAASAGWGLLFLVASFRRPAYRNQIAM